MLVILLVMVIGGVIAITQAQRKVPVQYAQRAVGRKMYSGGTSFMPLRVNSPASCRSFLRNPSSCFRRRFLQGRRTWPKASALPA